jgi:alkylhydroperoxidase family enzyme
VKNNRAIIAPPTRIPLLLRLGIWAAERVSGADLLVARLLAWYPRAAVSSAVLEGLIAHHDGRLDGRLLKLVRLAVSFTAGCPFCVDMNGAGWEKQITPAELKALRGDLPLEEVETFAETERLAVEYARLASRTPLHFPPEFTGRLQAAFSEREIVVLATTAAQVNYWTRLIQALGCPPAGFSGPILYLELPEAGPGKEPG